MKKKVLFAAGAMIIAAAVSAAVCLNIGQTRHNDLFEQNLDALARGEGTSSGYDCPGACLTWTGSTGGGLDCMCDRYADRCKTWCSK